MSDNNDDFNKISDINCEDGNVISQKKISCVFLTFFDQ